MPSARTYGFVLAFFRLAVGLFWLSHGIPKFTHPEMFMPPTGIFGEVVTNGLAATHGIFHNVLATLVAPNLAIFAELVRLGEVVAGALLVLGFFTRLGGLIGVFLALNYILVKHHLGSVDGWSSLDGAALLMSAVNLVLPTGRVLGLDWLLGRLRRTPSVAPAASGPSTAPMTAEFVEEAPMAGPTAPRD